MHGQVPAAQRCGSLRDNLWHLLGSKIAAVIVVDDRYYSRLVGLATAGAVTIGAGDRSTADELVHQKIQPYVDNDIRND
ncbi:hypothetical protein DIJ64_01950 [Mycobacterium leprae]|nr:hypothetical protein [Mycobacterium leprae]AWV47300.1 hypothetical protein DIJ64_01950 [Mycobacterium leprae]OAR21502.1 hypothetical protein A8144_05685 [Mycobacterium leprae 3125609]OAX71441.1 hypothetical protein A3216_05830 [Mycobacterium leprae 7935681]